MDTLENIGDLVERLAGKIEALIDEREYMLMEISSLRERLTERDKEAVKSAQDMCVELEAARMDALRFDQERIRIEKSLQSLNDRLEGLAESCRLSRAAVKSAAEVELLG